MEKREPSYTAGGNVNWYSYYGEQNGGFLKNQKLCHHMIQQTHFLAYIQGKTWFENIHAQHYSLQHCF